MLKTKIFNISPQGEEDINKFLEEFEGQLEDGRITINEETIVIMYEDKQNHPGMNKVEFLAQLDEKIAEVQLGVALSSVEFSFWDNEMIKSKGTNKQQDEVLAKRREAKQNFKSLQTKLHYLRETWKKVKKMNKLDVSQVREEEQ